MNSKQNEWNKWEEAQHKAMMEKVFGTKRLPKDPAREKRYEYDKKKKQLKFWHTKENHTNTRISQKRFRRKWTTERATGEWHIPVIHEYHTSGYETW